MEYIFLSGEVGFEITPTILAEKFNELKEKEVTIYVNTVGGNVFDGIAIYDFLKLQQKNGYHITTVASGVSASAGTVIFLAGNKDSRKVHNTTTFQIHNVWTFGGGDADDLEKQAREIKAINNKVAEIYEAETNLTKEQALAQMKLDESSTAEWLLENGFASEIIKYEAVATKRKLNLNYNKMESNLSKGDKSWIEQKFNALAKLFTPKNKIIQDANGVEIDFYELEDGQEPKVGDKAKIDGNPANGEVVIPSGETYVFVDGELTEIKPKEDDANAELEALKQENADLKEKLAGYETAQNKLQEAENKIEQMTTEFNQFKNELKSKFNYDKKDAGAGKQEKDGIRNRKVFEN